MPENPLLLRLRDKIWKERKSGEVERDLRARFGGRLASARPETRPKVAFLRASLACERFVTPPEKHTIFNHPRNPRADLFAEVAKSHPSLGNH